MAAQVRAALVVGATLVAAVGCGDDDDDSGPTDTGDGVAR